MNIKRFGFFAFLVLFISLPFFTFATEKLDHFSLNNVNFSLSENWVLLATSNRNIVIKHHQDIATLNIQTKVMFDIVTANRVKEIRSVSHFDGWISALDRPGKAVENKRANVKDSHVSVFVKKQLESNLKLSERIIGEYYFVKDDLQVVVSISTTKQRWRNVQSDFKQFLNLFWVGVIKETEIKYQNDYSNWEMDGTNSSNPNYIKATPQIHRPLTQQWVQQIKTDASLQTKSVIANNMFILMDSAKLTAIKISSGDMLWSFDLNHQFRKDFISIKNNLIFLIQEIPKKQIVALIPETGEIIQKIPVSNLVGAPVFTQDSIVFYDTNKLWSFHIALSNLNWSKDLSIAENGYLTAINDHLICQLDTGEIVNIDTQTGDIKWTSYKKYDLSNKPVLTEDQIILPVEHKRKIDDRLIALTLSDGVENWQFKKPLLKMEITQSPSINGDVIICPTQIKYKDQESKERSDFVLFSIDPKNGAVFWQKSYTPDTQKRPIITENVVYINNLNQEVMLFDSLTGEIIPTAMNQFKPAELLFSFQLRPYKNLVIKTIHKDKLIEIICES